MVPRCSSYLIRTFSEEISEDRSLILQFTELALGLTCGRLMVRFCTLIIVSLVHVKKAVGTIHSVAAPF